MGCSSSRAHRIEELRRSFEWPLSDFPAAQAKGLFGASAALHNHSALVASIASPLAGGKWPADPVAQGLPHDEVEVAALQPRQLLGEQGHALPPRARHAGDVRAPEHSLGTERVETAMQVRMQAAERVVVL